MNRMIDALVRAMGRFFGWMFGTRNGWIFFGAVMFAVMITFQSELLTQMLSATCGWLLNVLAATVKKFENLFVKLLEVVFSLLVICGIVCYGLYKPTKAMFKSPKK